MIYRILTEAECQRKYLKWLQPRATFDTILAQTLTAYAPFIYDQITNSPITPFIEFLKKGTNPPPLPLSQEER